MIIKMNKEIEQIRKRLLSKRKVEEPRWENGLSTGATLLNLACTGNADVGLLPGHYYLFVGDSDSGKTWISHSCLAEAAHNPKFSKYRFIYDNPEDGALMDVAKFFGQKTADRIEPPSGTKAKPIYSKTIDEFYYYLDEAIKENSPFIFIEDSMDALSSESEQEKFQENKKAHFKGKETTGSYGDGKAKVNSSGIRQILHNLKTSGSILIVICQSRANLGFGAKFNPKTRSGGNALTFYATSELWFSIKERMKVNYKGKARKLGTLSKAHVKRTRLTGGEYDVEIPIYRKFGIDDTGSMVDFLVEEKHWTESDGTIIAKEIGFKGKREKLIEFIEEKCKQTELKNLVVQVWQEIEKACEVKRKPRYE